MLYTSPALLTHCSVAPVIAPGVAGVAGLTVTANVFAALVPQLLLAVTLTLPFCPAVPDVTVIEIVPCPPVILQPAGTVHA